MTSKLNLTAQKLANLGVQQTIADKLAMANVRLANGDLAGAAEAFGQCTALCQYKSDMAAQGRGENPALADRVEVAMVPAGEAPMQNQIIMLKSTIMYLVAQCGGEIVLTDATMKSIPADQKIESFRDEEQNAIVYRLVKPK